MTMLSGSKNMEGDYDYAGGILIIQALRYYTLRRYAQVEANGQTGILGTRRC